MISKIAFWSFPGPGRAILNLQLFGSDEVMQIEVPEEQFNRLLWTGTYFVLCESKVPKREAAE